MSDGGLIAIWGGLSKGVGGLPDAIGDTFETLKWFGYISLAIVGSGVLLVSLSFLRGSQSMSDVVTSVKG
jgi:hypothetical protein